MVYLAKGGFWLTGKNIIASATALLLAIAYANLLPKETYAQYKYIFSIVSLLTITTMPGMLTAVTRAVARGNEGSVFEAIKIRLKWSLLGILAGIITAGYYFYQGNNVLGICFLIASIFHILTIDLFYAPYLQGKKLFKILAIYKSINQVLLVLMIIGGLFISTNIIFFIAVYFISGFIIHLALFLFTFKKIKPNKKTDEKSLTFGKHLSFMNVLGAISEQFDKILMWHFLGPIQLAIYSFAILPVDQIRNMAKTFNILSLPKLSIQNKETLKKTLPSKILKFSLILLIPTVFYILLCSPIFKIIFPEYLESVKYTKIYAFSLLLFPLRLFAITITAHAKTKYMYILKIFNPLIKIGLMIIFINIFGILGLILGILLSTLINSALSYILFKRI